MTKSNTDAGLLGQDPNSESASGQSGQPPEGSSSGSETQQTPPNPQPSEADARTPHNEADKIQAVSELLNPEAKPEKGAEKPEKAKAEGDAVPLKDQEADPKAGKVDPTALTVNAIAEKLEIKPEDVYKLSVTTGDGDTVTLSALKDAYADRQKAARETATREASLDQRETAILAQQRLWSQIGGELAGKLTPQTQTALREQAQAHDRRERQLMLQAMPEMADPSAFANWREQLVDTLKGYGFRPAEMVITDHRMLVVMRDLMRTKERLARLTSYEPTKEPPKPAQQQGRAGPPSKKHMAKRARAGTEADRIKAVASLLE